MANDVQWIRVSGGGKERWMGIDEAARIKPGPIRHQTLPEWMLEMARDLYERVGFVLVPTLEQWELGFMRDQNPDRELLTWEAIAAAFERCVRRWPDRDRRELVGVLAALTTGSRRKAGSKPRDLKLIKGFLKEARWDVAERLRGEGDA